MAPRTATRHLTSPSFRVVSIDVGLRNLGLGIVRWLSAEDEAALRSAPVPGILRFESEGLGGGGGGEGGREEEAAPGAPPSPAAQRPALTESTGPRASSFESAGPGEGARKRGRPPKAMPATLAKASRTSSRPSKAQIQEILQRAKEAGPRTGEEKTQEERADAAVAEEQEEEADAAVAGEQEEEEAAKEGAVAAAEESPATAKRSRAGARKAREPPPPPPDTLALIKSRILVEHAENIDVLEENRCKAKNSKGVGPLRQVAFWHECMVRRAALLLDPPPDIVVVEVQDGGNATMRQVSTGIVGLFMGHFEALHRAGLIARVPEFAMIRGDMKLKVCRLIQGDPVADKSAPKLSRRKPAAAAAAAAPAAAPAAATAMDMAGRAAALSVPEYLKRINPRKYFALLRANEMEARARAEAVRFGLLGEEEAGAGAEEEEEQEEQEEQEEEDEAIATLNPAARRRAGAATARAGAAGAATAGAGRRGGPRKRGKKEEKATLARYGADPAAAPRSKTTGRNHSAYELRKRLAVASFERYMDEQLRERPHLICRELRDGWKRYTQKKRRDISDALLQGMFLVTRHLALPMPG